MFQSCVVLGYWAYEVLFWAGVEAVEWKGKEQLDCGKCCTSLVWLLTG